MSTQAQTKVTASAEPIIVQLFGVQPRHIPLLFLGGLAFLVMTAPDLFDAAARGMRDTPVVGWTTEHLDAVATWFTAKIQDPSNAEMERILLETAVIAAVTLIPAAAYRSVRTRLWWPLGLVLGGGIAGLLAIPAIAALVEIALVVLRTVPRISSWMLSWLLPVLLVAAALVAVLGAGLLLLLLRRPRGQEIKITTSVALVVVALLIARHESDRLDFLFSLGRQLRDAMEWIITAALFVLLIFGLLAAITQIGRSTVSPLLSAPLAGRHAGKCVDLAAGSGVVLSLLLCAAVVNDPFRATFSEVWTGSAVLGQVPPPVELYDLLLPDLAVDFLATLYPESSVDPFNPTVDCALLLVTATLGLLSLAFGTRSWEHLDSAVLRARLLVATGFALLVSVPVLVLMSLTRDPADS